eukprot:scaffold3917_cov113-Isochrysis_galbana.AAC.8
MDGCFGNSDGLGGRPTARRGRGISLSLKYHIHACVCLVLPTGTRSMGMTLLESPRLAWVALLAGSILEAGRGTDVLLDL